MTTALTTRERLIEAGSRRFYRDGFRDVGIDRILEDVGISKTAFYKHFESKEDLMLAVMRAQDAWLREHFARMVTEKGGNEPRARLLALFDVVDELIRVEEFRGCFFVNVAMEFPLPHDPAHEAAAENKRALHEIIARLAREAGADDAGTLATELMLLMEGVYVTRQVTGDRQAAGIAKRAAETLIERRISAL